MRIEAKFWRALGRPQEIREPPPRVGWRWTAVAFGGGWGLGQALPWWPPSWVLWPTAAALFALALTLRLWGKRRRRQPRRASKFPRGTGWRP